jgi:hypothetical protein
MDPYKTATWRFEQVAFLFDDSLTEDERQRELASAAKTPVKWPGGDVKPIHRSTLYRWKSDYEEPCKRCPEMSVCKKTELCGPRLQGLMPKRRSDAGIARSVKPEWIERAILLLLERPQRSLAFLLLLLATYFTDLNLSRSTLSRRLTSSTEGPRPGLSVTGP